MESNLGRLCAVCWDTFFGELIQPLDEKEIAYCSVIEIVNTLTPSGFIPNFVCQNNFKSYDRSQSPVGSMAVLDIYNRYHDKWLLSEVYDSLCI